MIYFLYGTDIYTSRKKMHSILDVLCKKRPDSEIFKINSESFNEERFDELIYSQGLFDSKYIVVLDNLLEEKGIKEFLADRFVEMKDSLNVFVWLENKVDAKTLKEIEKNSEKTQEFTKKEDGFVKKKELPVFSITDGLLEKNKKRFWVSYIDLLSKGAGPEELHGIIFWQVKNMLIASKADSQKDSGLAPYPYKNALTGGRRYKEDELVSMMSDLVSMTHKVRVGEGDLDIMLEKWILRA